MERYRLMNVQRNGEDLCGFDKVECTLYNHVIYRTYRKDVYGSVNKSYDAEAVARNVPMEPIPDERRAQYLRPGELLACQAQCPVAYQPVGTLEWHGRQNPIGCDAIKAEQLCLAAAKRVGGVVMPSIYFSSDAIMDVGHGYARGMDAVAGFALPGSFYQIHHDHFIQLLTTACQNYLARGFRLVLLVSGHNPSFQQNLMDEVCFAFTKEAGSSPVRAMMEYAFVEEGNPRRHSDHAGAYETSMMRYLASDRVNMQANQGQVVDQLAIWGEHAGLATAEEGRLCFELQTEGMVRYVQEALAAL